MSADVVSAKVRRATWLRRWWAVAGLALFAATWKLWTPQTEFPQVPLFGWAGSLPAVLDRLAFGVLLGSLASAALRPGSRRSWLAIVASLSVLLVLDQHRLQPWAWQLLLMATVWMASNQCDSQERFARLLRVVTISIYFWSAVSKLDAAFSVSHGPTLIEALFQSVSINAVRWPASVKWWLAFSLPLGELLVAIGLCWPHTRRAALIAATALHVGLILALGPTGLGHRPGVLWWNIAFIRHDWLLFGVRASDAVTPPSLSRWFRAFALRATPLETTLNVVQKPDNHRDKLGGVGCVSVILFACVWPITERQGLCDHWLAWSVYSTRIERVSVTLTDEGVRRLPVSAQRLVVAGELWLDRWSLSALDVPIYPQLRFQLGVVEGLRQRCGEENIVEVVVQRGVSGIERLTVEQCDERRRQFWINTRPR